MALKNISILVVDDEPELRVVLRTCFEQAGAKVFDAESGNRALTFLKKNAVDVVFSDCRMPDGDGFFLLESIRSKIDKTPIIFILTGSSEIKHEDFEVLGASGVFNKPFDVGVVIAGIARAIEDARAPGGLING